jgi:hypothetical protein
MWGLTYGLPPLILYIFGSPHVAVTRIDFRAIRHTDIATAQLVALAAYGAMMAGYALPAGRRLAWLLPRPRREWSRGITLAAVAFMVPLGWSVYLGGQYGFLPERLGTGVTGSFASATLYGIALLNICYRRYRSHLALLGTIILIPVTMAFNFFTGSKTLFLAPLAMVALSYLVIERRVRILWIVLAVGAIAFFYPVSEFYRTVVMQGLTKSAVEVLQDPGTALGLVADYASEYDLGDYLTVGLVATSHRVNGLGILSVIVRDTPDRVPYQGGWTIGYIFLSYVPRVLWPDKPYMTWGQWVTDNYTAPGMNVKSATGSSWPGELYLNFGIPGVILGMIVLGIYLRWLHEYVFPPSNPIPFVLFAVVVLYSTLPTLQGGLVGVINQPIFNGWPILLTHLVIRILFPSAPARDPTLAHQASSDGRLTSS